MGGIINLSMGFMGIQMGFGLQNGNASRILANFGADVHELSYFWIVAPLTGLIVQPIIGHMGDNTWTRLGRRKPYFLAGQLLTDRLKADQMVVNSVVFFRKLIMRS